MAEARTRHEICSMRYKQAGDAGDLNDAAPAGLLSLMGIRAAARGNNKRAAAMDATYDERALPLAGAHLLHHSASVSTYALKQ